MSLDVYLLFTLSSSDRMSQFASISCVGGAPFVLVSAHDILNIINKTRVFPPQFLTLFSNLLHLIRVDEKNRPAT